MTCVGNKSWSQSRGLVCMTCVSNKSVGHGLEDRCV